MIEFRPYKPAVPFEDYLKRYTWLTCDELLFDAECIALISYYGRDIIIQLKDGVPSLLEPLMNRDIYYKFQSAKPLVMKYVRLWCKSGFYKSIHLKEFLNNIMAKKIDD